jgi:hypothetical protein
MRPEYDAIDLLLFLLWSFCSLGPVAFINLFLLEPRSRPITIEIPFTNDNTGVELQSRKMKKTVITHSNTDMVVHLRLSASGKTSDRGP